MAASVDTQRLREEFARVAGDIDSDDEARLASPGVEGMVKFLGSITEGEGFGNEQIRHAFQAKEWAEGVDLSWSDLEALVETLIASATKVETQSITENTSSTMNDHSSLPSKEDMARQDQSTVSSQSKSEDADSNKRKALAMPAYPVTLGATEDEAKERTQLLEKITSEQSIAAEASILEAYKSYRSNVGRETAELLPDSPPDLFAAKHYYRNLSEAMTAQRAASPPRLPAGFQAVIASPMKRQKKHPVEPEEVKIAGLHATAKVGAVVHVNGYLMGAEEGVRSVDVSNGTTGETSSSNVINIVLADEGGAIQLTLWREQARNFFPVLDKAMDTVRENFCAKAKFTNLMLRDVRYPGPKIRMLHSTENTELVLAGEQKLQISPAPHLFPTKDFRDLNKLSLPVMLHLKGIVTGDIVERTTSKGAEQICFSLMDGNKRTVSCIGHEIPFPSESFQPGMEIALFCATVQEGIRKGTGNVWVYAISYIVFLGNKGIPEAPIEAISIRGKA